MGISYIPILTQIPFRITGPFRYWNEISFISLLFQFHNCYICFTLIMAVKRVKVKLIIRPFSPSNFACWAQKPFHHNSKAKGKVKPWLHWIERKGSIRVFHEEEVWIPNYNPRLVSQASISNLLFPPRCTEEAVYCGFSKSDPKSTNIVKLISMWPSL